MPTIRKWGNAVVNLLLDHKKYGESHCHYVDFQCLRNQAHSNFIIYRDIVT